MLHAGCRTWHTSIASMNNLSSLVVDTTLLRQFSGLKPDEELSDLSETQGLSALRLPILKKTLTVYGTMALI